MKEEESDAVGVILFLSVESYGCSQVLEKILF